MSDPSDPGAGGTAGPGDLAGLVVAARAALADPALDAVDDDALAPLAQARKLLDRVLRELGAGVAGESPVLAALEDLYGESVLARGGEAQAAILLRRFAKDIRTGMFDGACAMGVRAILREQVEAELAALDPDLLAARRAARAGSGRSRVD